MKTQLIVLGLAIVAAGCASDRQAGAPGDSLTPLSAAARADSLASMPALLRRFQSATGAPPTSLASPAPTREALARAFVAALERGDGVALAAMRVSPAEFAHLFFPESIFMRPPYELDPEVVWIQLDAASNAGLRRALDRHAGKPLGYVELTCQPPQTHGAVRLHGCDVVRLRAPGDTIRDRMFGAILERDGGFKFLSLENRL